ncbi:MAG TPA: hypothetical protein VL125_04800 [Pelobium sp.]|nr:hypothetical protein [Pelobium sp.]
MKYIVLIMLLMFSKINLIAQSKEAQQLLLNYEKLKQMKNTLEDMKRGYEVLKNGYNSVKNVTEGNFNLHDVFLGKLMAISPVVRNYRRIGDIIICQKNLVREYKQAFSRFSESNLFNAEELKYLGRIYKNLFTQSIQSLDELTMVLTANKLKMSDDERLKSIDRIFADSEDKLDFLRNFNRQTQLLLSQRNREQESLQQTQKLYQINN